MKVFVPAVSLNFFFIFISMANVSSPALRCQFACPLEAKPLKNLCRPG